MIGDNLKGDLLYAYVAGIIDGEGSIIIRKRIASKTSQWFTLCVQVGHTSEWLVHFLQVNFPKSLVIGPYQSKTLPNSKPSWRWQIEAKAAGELLETIMPYLQLKRPQAELGLRFQARRTNLGRSDKKKTVLDEAEKIVMGRLNQRGVNSKEKS